MKTSLAGTHQLGPLAPLFNAMKQHLLERALAGTCTPEEAITLDELVGKCPDAPNGWFYCTKADGAVRVSAGWTG